LGDKKYKEEKILLTLIDFAYDKQNQSLKTGVKMEVAIFMVVFMSAYLLDGFFRAMY